MHQQFWESSFVDQSVTKTLFSNYKVMNYMLEMKNSYGEILKILPKNSAYVIFEINQPMDEVYIGFCRIQAEKPKPIYSVKKFKMTKDVLMKLNYILSEQKNIAGMLYKTPILTEEEAHKLEEEKNRQYEGLMEEFIEIMEPFFSHLDTYINQRPDSSKEEEEEESQAVIKDQKDATTNKKPPPAKGAKGAQAQNTPVADFKLKTTTSGIESMILLVDERFIE